MHLTEGPSLSPPVIPLHVLWIQQLYLLSRRISFRRTPQCPMPQFFKVSSPIPLRMIFIFVILTVLSPPCGLSMEFQSLSLVDSWSSVSAAITRSSAYSSSNFEDTSCPALKTRSGWYGASSNFARDECIPYLYVSVLCYVLFLELSEDKDCICRASPR